MDDFSIGELIVVGLILAFAFKFGGWFHGVLVISVIVGLAFSDTIVGKIGFGVFVLMILVMMFGVFGGLTGSDRGADLDDEP